MYRKVRGLLFVDRVIMESSVYSYGTRVLEYATKSRISYFKQYKSICIKIPSFSPCCFPRYVTRV